MDSDPLEELNSEERETLASLARSKVANHVSRRSVIQAALSVGVGAAIGVGGSKTFLGDAAGQPDAGDGDANLGGPNNRYDAWFDGQDVRTLYNNTYAESVNDFGNFSGDTTVDISEGNMVTGTLTGDVSLSFTNPVDTSGDTDTDNYQGNALFLKFEQDGAEQYTINWPSSVTWVDPGGEPDDPSTGTEIEVALQSYDGGSTWYGGEVARY